MENITVDLIDPKYTPVKAHESDAGYDLKARIENTDNLDYELAQWLLDYKNKIETLKKISSKLPDILPPVYLPKFYINGELYIDLNNINVNIKTTLLEDLQKTNYTVLLPSQVYEPKLVSKLSFYKNYITIPTGVKLTMQYTNFPCPPEYMGTMCGFINTYPVSLITPRSGWASKFGISLLNSPGVIDVGYQNELGVVLENRGKDIHFITDTSRIAQALFFDCYSVGLKLNFQADINVQLTERGTAGFGSSNFI